MTVNALEPGRPKYLQRFLSHQKKEGLPNKGQTGSGDILGPATGQETPRCLEG